ncbi:MAG: hydrogenase subunit MbhD domain-containing protein [Candidatus Altiarchaeota archaeon]
MDLDLTQILISLLIILSGFFVVYFKDLLSAIISMAVLGLVISLEFYILQAPDVAIAEAGIGACLTTAIFIITLRKINFNENG